MQIIPPGSGYYGHMPIVVLEAEDLEEHPTAIIQQLRDEEVVFTAHDEHDCVIVRLPFPHGEGPESITSLDILEIYLHRERANYLEETANLRRFVRPAQPLAVAA